jgi:hypothetical protein
VRVRCSRCKHAFEVRKEGAGPPPAAPGLDDEESDWQFNEDPPREDPAAGPGDSGSGAAGVVDDLLGSSGADRDDVSLEDEDARASSPSGLELSEDPPPAPESDVDADDGEDLFSASHDLDTDFDSTPEPPPGSPSPPEEESPDLDLDFDLGLGGEPPSEAPLSATERAELVEDPAAALAQELSTELDRDVARELSDDADRKLVVPAGPDELASEDWDALAGGQGKRRRTRKIDPEALLGDRSRLLAALRGAGQGAGWLAVAALFALGLRGGLFPDAALAGAAPAGAVHRPVSIEVSGGLQLEEISARFVDHAEAGPVYVVTGRLHNAGSQTLEAGTVAMVVVDPSGHQLTAPAQAAAPLSTHAVRQGRLDGPWRRSPRLQPGESRPFEAVVGALPRGAQSLRIVRLAPGELPGVPEPADTAAASADPDPAGEAPGAGAEDALPAEVAADDPAQDAAPPAAVAP